MRSNSDEPNHFTFIALGMFGLAIAACVLVGLVIAVARGRRSSS